MDIKEAEKVLRMKYCPKCHLSADTLMHRFCTHKVCPVREALAAKYGPRTADRFNGSE